MHSALQPRPVSAFGDLLRDWRRARRRSQLELALQADVSARHVSFIETGRATPSREMVLALADALAVPLRERNALLQAAGYAPVFRETPLDDPQMAEMLRAIKLILQQHGPTGGAVAFDRRWDVVMANASYVRFMRLLLGGAYERVEPFELIPAPRPNVLRQLFDPAGLRPFIANWDVLAPALLSRLRQEVAWSRDPASQELLQSLLAFPGVPDQWQKPELESRAAFVLPVELSLPAGTLRLFSTITTLGTPQDITLQELRVESFHAADDSGECLARRLLDLA